jgi:hypothetical protein
MDSRSIADSSLPSYSETIGKISDVIVHYDQVHSFLYCYSVIFDRLPTKVELFMMVQFLQITEAEIFDILKHFQPEHEYPIPPPCSECAMIIKMNLERWNLQIARYYYRALNTQQRALLSCMVNTQEQINKYHEIIDNSLITTSNQDGMQMF